jgi:acyl dehydratase
MRAEVGWALPEKVIGPRTLNEIVRYQGASGDFNPIHHDAAFAASAGFPDVFSVGMLQAGELATYATEVFGADNVRRFGVQFREQVWLGDVLTCSGEVTAVTRGEGGDEKVVEVALTMVRQTGGVVLSGTATYAVPGETA